MENKKLISIYEFTPYNLIVEITTEILYLYLIYFVYQKSKEIFASFIRFGKRFYMDSINTSNIAIKLINFVFTCIILTLGISIFYFILIYVFDLTSFIKLRTKLFTIWKQLFRSDSNLTDFNSFFNYYCHSSGAEVDNGQNNKYFVESITYLCGWSVLHTVFIELIQIILTANIILVIIKEGNRTDIRNNVRSDLNRVNNRLTYYLDFILFILDQVVKIFFYFQCIYFIIVLLCMLNNYRSMKSIHTMHNTYDTDYTDYSTAESLLNQTTSTYHTSSESSHELPYTSTNQDEDEPDTSTDSTKSAFNIIITIIIEIIQLLT